MENTFPQFFPIMQGGRQGPGMTVYIDSAPYPKVEDGDDPATVALLKEDYAGAEGELSGVLQYVYQHMMSEGDESFANAMLQIAIVEMTHLDMLGDAIKALGGSPTFDNGKFYWDTSNVDYAAGLQEMLQANINAEKTAIANYGKHAAQTANVFVKALLERIIKDEELHLRFFEETLAGLGR